MRVPSASRGLLVLEDPSQRYGPRTRANATAGDVTVAFAVDFSTAGEKLTRTAAGDRFLPLDLGRLRPIEAARALFVELRRRNGKVLNVAGNGLATLSRHGWDQDRADTYVHDVLETVHRHWPLERIVSGGQTGIDLAGAVAGVALGIAVIVRMPRGLVQRTADGKDAGHTVAEIMQQVETGARRLGALTRPAAQPVSDGAKPR